MMEELEWKRRQALKSPVNEGCISSRVVYDSNEEDRRRNGLVFFTPKRDSYREVEKQYFGISTGNPGRNTP